jgi:hypothetical protein
MLVELEAPTIALFKENMCYSNTFLSTHASGRMWKTQLVQDN